MPDWLKDWGTLVIALFGAFSGGFSLVINALNRRDALRKEAKARAAAEPWAELAGEPAGAGFTMRVGIHNPSGKVFVLREARIDAPEGWQIVTYASPYFRDPERPPARPEIVSAGRSISFEHPVRLPSPGKGTLATRLDFSLEPIQSSAARTSNTANAISVAMRFSGTWVSAKAERIDLPAKITLPLTASA